MALISIASAIGLIVDQREIVGAAAWAKPLKFSLSILLYAVTLAWLIGLLRRWQRAAWWAGTITSVVLAIEMVIIVGAVMADTTSHFNVATPFASAMWTTMAISVVIAWLASLLVGILLFRTDLGSAARSIAIRAGVALSLVGMALAFQMARPTAAQLASPTGVEGAHAVGADDGGQGLFLLGWSTIGGDLRIPHFVGMHALQALPILVVLLGLLAPRIPVLRGPVVQARLVTTAAAIYLGVLVILEVQAVIGQSIVSPSAPVVIATLSLCAGGAIAVGIILRAAGSGPSGLATTERPTSTNILVGSD